MVLNVGTLIHCLWTFCIYFRPSSGDSHPDPRRCLCLCHCHGLLASLSPPPSVLEELGGWNERSVIVNPVWLTCLLDRFRFDSNSWSHPQRSPRSQLLFHRNCTGWLSWDDFFTRRFNDIDKTRPLPPDVHSADVIVSACESTIYHIQEKVSEFDIFWLKEKSYSLKIMLNDDEYAPLFYGGTVYQAFLDVTDYHRWVSPVSGRVATVVNVPGTYYALPPAFDPPPPPPNGNGEVVGIVEAQAYLAVSATRALIFIESDNRAIGLVCFIGVGMIEVSTCEITVRAGDHVNKGDQIGMFHLGGSTSAIIFRPGVKFTLDKHLVPPPNPHPSHVAIRSKLGTLVPVQE